MNKCTILAIETSCDDSSIAILKDNKIINNVIWSSAEIQNEYGGVVPEIAAREHAKNIMKALRQACKDIDISEIDYIAYTNEPGLRVSLNVGEALATSLSILMNKPLIPVNHIYAHLFSFIYDNHQAIQYPMLGLVISGGHTSIFKINSPTNIQIINETKDDAVGEVFDKISRTLELGYPGGPKIDKLFDINKTTIKFLNLKPKPSDNFSFSGLKTKVLNFINQAKMKKNKIDKQVIASSFQKEIIDIVVDKIIYYLDKYQIDGLAIGGGVAANSYLESKLKSLNIKLYMPKDKVLCGDNAAMIAIYAGLLVN